MTKHQGSDALGALRIESRIVIDAPPETVWKVTVGIADWPIWSPTVRAVQWLDGASLNEGR